MGLSKPVDLTTVVAGLNSTVAALADVVDALTTAGGMPVADQELAELALTNPLPVSESAPTSAADYSGTTSAELNTPTTIEFAATSKGIHFKNTDAAKVVSASFDEGVTWVDFAVGDPGIDLFVARTSIQVKSVLSASAAFRCVVLS